MANPGYVRSTDGSDADNGSTWALANATAAGAVTDAAAGDRIFFSQVHSESTAGAVTLNWPGTAASPNQLICGNDAAEPPTAVATGAVIATSGGNNIQLNGSLYAYGLTLSAGTSTNFAMVSLAQSDSNAITLEDCTLTLGNSNTSSRINLGSTGGSFESTVELINCTFKFGSTSQGIQIGNTDARIRGGSISGAGSAITTFIASATINGKSFVVEGFDFSSAATGLNLIAGSSSGQGRHIFRNCKMPASWSGGIFASAPSIPGVRGEMWNCSATDTNYSMWVEDYAGSIKHETTIVRTGGASDGDTAISWKMASTANAEYPQIPLRSPEIFVPNTTTGASKTLTVEIAQDGTTTALNDDEVWLEVEYLGTSGFSLALFADDAKADVLATATAQANSSETWSGLSGTNKKQSISVTLTPQEEGVYIVRVCLAKASTTVYVCPKVTVA